MTVLPEFLVAWKENYSQDQGQKNHFQKSNEQFVLLCNLDMILGHVGKKLFQNFSVNLCISATKKIVPQAMCYDIY